MAPYPRGGKVTGSKAQTRGMLSIDGGRRVGERKERKSGERRSIEGKDAGESGDRSRSNGGVIGVRVNSCVYTSAGMWACVDTCACACARARMRVCVYACACACVRVCVCACVSVSACVCACVCVCVCVRVWRACASACGGEGDGDALTKGEEQVPDAQRGLGGECVDEAEHEPLSADEAELNAEIGQVRGHL
eukprot:6184141-Pleurochrysis_carterae.AAC.2